MTLLLAALALALQADLPKDMPRATYSPDLEPAVMAAKTLSCGMTREDVKEAFRDVRPPDSKEIYATDGLERVQWEEKETTPGGYRYCVIDVLLHFPDLSKPSNLLTVDVLCGSTSARSDQWGELAYAQNQVFRLECEKVAKERPIQRTGPGKKPQPAAR